MTMGQKSVYYESCFLNPQPGDVWHERLQLNFLVVSVVSDLIIVSKAYNLNNERFLETDPSKFIAFSREEFENQCKFCDPLETRNTWTQLIKSMNLPEDILENLDIRKIVEDKLSEIKLGNIPEVRHLRDPQCGDVWKIQRDQHIIILDKYLKDYLIISCCDSSSVTQLLNGEKQFTDFRVIHREEFRFCVLNNQTIEQGFSAKVEPLLLKDAVQIFKQDN